MRFPFAGRRLAALGAATLAACAGATKVVRPLEGEPPSRIAVLPLEGSLSPRGRAILRSLLGSLLADRNYAKLEDEAVDARLALEGLAPWEPDWLPPDEVLAAVGRTLGAEALVVGEEFADSRFSAGIAFRRGLSGRLRLLDARTAETIWSAEVGASETGGVLLESGQVIRAFQETIESGGEVTFGRLAASLALDAAEAFPRNPRPAQVGARPQVESVTVSRIATAPGPPDLLAAGDTVEITARGTPGGRGRASVAAVAEGIPLVEEEPGVYRGRLRIEAGHGEGSGPAVVTLFDPFGNPSASTQSSSIWSLFAPRLDPPAALSATLVDPEGRRVRLRWEASAGAAAYVVGRVAGGNPVTLEAGARLEIEDLVPDGGETATYVVASRSAAGAVGPPSAATSVRLDS